VSKRFQGMGCGIKGSAAWPHAASGGARNIQLRIARRAGGGVRAVRVGAAECALGQSTLPWCAAKLLRPQDWLIGPQKGTKNHKKRALQQNLWVTPGSPIALKAAKKQREKTFGLLMNFNVKKLTERFRL
jgi:hypothetical protein